jgi:alkylation response protein AidB-like acyl-CoA dehydrogenase
MSIFDKDLTEDQIMMRDVCRRFVDNTIIPFISSNWKNEWDLTPESRLPDSILQDADKIGIRIFAVPEEYGGMPLD